MLGKPKTNELPEWANEPEEWGFMPETSNSDDNHYNEMMQAENWPDDDHNL
jgi:hypothetical protein